MLRPARMERVELLGLRSRKDEILSSIQELGVLHLEHVDLDLEQETPSDLLHTAIKTIDRVDRVIRILEPSPGLRERLLGPRQPRVRTHGSGDRGFAFWSLRIVERECSRIEALDREREDLEREVSRLKTLARDLELFRGCEIRVERLGSWGRVFSCLCIVPEEKLYLLEKLGQVEEYGRKSERGEILVGVAVAVSSSKKNELEAIARIIDTSGLAGTPRECQKSVLRELHEKRKRLAEIERELEDSRRDALPLLRGIRERWENIRERLAGEKNLARTRSVFVATGWVPRDSLERLEAVRDLVIVKKGEKGNPPTLLSNPRFARMFEVFTRWYGLPEYNEYDPTLLIALCYPLFFGMIIGDIGYALPVLASSGFLYANSRNREVRDIAGVLLVSGVFGLLFGVLFGSFFGGSVSWLPGLLSPISSPIALLLVALGMGLVHINTGILLGVLNGVHKRDRDLFLDSVSKIFIQAGLVLVVGMVLGVFPSWAGLAGGACLGASIAIEGRKGIAGVLSMPGFVGSWISYSRLMALSVATAWLGTVVNMFAGFASSVSLVVAGVFLGVGHGFLVVVNGLSAFVHSLRLHYVEFFQRFYSGSGRPFSPLSLKREFHE